MQKIFRAFSSSSRKRLTTPAIVAQDEELKETIEGVEKNMNGAIQHLKQSLGSLRPGRADASVFDTLQVEAYGQSLSISQVAQVSVTSPQSLLLNVFDPSLVKNVEKSVQAMNSCYNTSLDGTNVQVSFPKTSKEVRLELIKASKKLSEQARQHARRARQDGINRIKKRKDELSEDDVRKLNDFVQVLTDDCINQIKAVFESKEKDLTQV